MQEDGAAVLVRPEGFADLDRACALLAGAARAAREIVDEIAGQPVWGLGEVTPRLISARTVVDRFRECGAQVGAALAGHDRIAGEIAQALVLVRDRMCAVDAASAAALRGLESPGRSAMSRGA
ncbi:hypothetical protein [Nocardia thailandica]|uniref:hypothetical protein n=1 Tax=Nocardia thailandica TaxID=257275 RepID=UPI0002F30A17|nr:hypothetical protein [Nocardia thailandica]